MAGMNRRVPQGKKLGKEQLGLLKRLGAYVFRDYGRHCLAVVILILVSVLANVQGTMFMRNLIDDYITPFLLSDHPNFSPLAHAIGKVAVFYAIGVVSTYLYNRIMVNVTQGTLKNMRDDLFSHMEKLPIRYFDSHAHGDIMSVYTNDIDTLRQMISQSAPQLINSAVTIVSVFVSMLILNIPLTVVSMIMVAIMVTGSKNTVHRRRFLHPNISIIFMELQREAIMLLLDVWKWALRQVNHRYLSLVEMAEEFRYIENCRERVFHLLQV